MTTIRYVYVRCDDYQTKNDDRALLLLSWPSRRVASSSRFGVDGSRNARAGLAICTCCVACALYAFTEGHATGSVDVSEQCQR